LFRQKLSGQKSPYLLETPPQPKSLAHQTKIFTAILRGRIAHVDLAYSGYRQSQQPARHTRLQVPCPNQTNQLLDDQLLDSSSQHRVPNPHSNTFPKQLSRLEPLAAAVTAATQPRQPRFARIQTVDQHIFIV
jgi:hypothetical protein